MTRLPRVLSYPPRHDYVDRLHGRAARLVHRDQPWPRLPDFYDGDWLQAHARQWDVAHFHFGWEQYPPQQLERVLAAHRELQTPVVWTAHDLHNPHLAHRQADEPHRRLLAASADVVITLTDGAAGELHARFGCPAQVVVHGPLLSPCEIRRHRRAGRSAPITERPLRVMLLAKSLRANLRWRACVEAVTGMPAAVPVLLDVHLHATAPARDEVERLATDPHVRLTVGPRLTRPSLLARLSQADALVLPYAWGTHSGLLELATDLGLQVVTTDVGHFGDQAPCHVVTTSQSRLDPAALRTLLCRLVDPASHLDPVTPQKRHNALREFVAAHAAIYATLGTAMSR